MNAYGCVCACGVHAPERQEACTHTCAYTRACVHVHTLIHAHVCAGTNNARMAGTLRNLASYYYKDPHMLFLVRLSQGLVHMGKGLVTINPYHTDRQLLSGARWQLLSGAR